MKLNDVGAQQALDKGVKRKRHPARQEIQEHHALTGAGIGDYLISGAPYSPTIRRRKAAVGLKPGEMSLGDAGGFPIPLHPLRRSRVTAGGTLLPFHHGEELRMNKTGEEKKKNRRKKNEEEEVEMRMGEMELSALFLFISQP